MDKGCFRAKRLPGAALHLPAVVATAHEVAAGMRHLTHQGLVHGDLSPYNVLLTSSGAAAATAGRGFTAKVVDAGLATTVAGGSTKQKLAAAAEAYETIAYMAPELLGEGGNDKDGSRTAACDVYSYGVLLWQMFTGERPWAGLGPAGIIQRVVVDKEVLPAPADMPPALADLVRSCCTWQPAARPTFEEVLAALPRLSETGV
jgi:serine/threonine protein kinase